MKPVLQKFLALCLMIVLSSGCLPKKFDVAIPKEIKLNLDAKTESQLKLVSEGRLSESIKRKAESLLDYSLKEIGDTILRSEEVKKVSGAIEKREKIECYSDSKDYLKVEKMAEANFRYRLYLICFDSSNLPNTEGMSESDQFSVMVSAFHVFIEGDVSWSNNALIVSTRNSEALDLSIKPMSLLVLKSARTHLQRLIQL